MTRPKGHWRNSLAPALAGGMGFWLVNFLISLTPIAAEYRAALSIPYLPMLLESLIGGLIIGFGVSWFLLRFSDKLPTRSPICTSVLLSLAVLVVVTVVLHLPASRSAKAGDAVRCFWIGTLFNALRIPALGAAVGLATTMRRGGARVDGCPRKVLRFRSSSEPMQASEQEHP